MKQFALIKAITHSSNSDEVETKLMWIRPDNILYIEEVGDSLINAGIKINPQGALFYQSLKQLLLDDVKVYAVQMNGTKQPISPFFYTTTNPSKFLPKD